MEERVNRWMLFGLAGSTVQDLSRPNLASLWTSVTWGYQRKLEKDREHRGKHPLLSH